MTANGRDILGEISGEGVSLWLDDLSRKRFEDGSLQRLIDEDHIVGVTTNPTIFDKALSEGSVYGPAVAAAAATASPEATAFDIMVADVARACDVFRPLYESTAGRDGRVSIEVSPLLAHDGDATTEQAKRLWAKVDRPNAMIKVPATLEGLPAITELIGSGISVNVTLIFSLDRYREVIEAYFDGLDRARRAGRDLSAIHSVASFFVSRVDTEVDRRLDLVATPEAAALRSKAGLANARLAYRVFEESVGSGRWTSLAAAGANLQRPLWASTGVKDPSLPPALYVTGLVAPNVVNTVPEKTLLAARDQGIPEGDTIRGTHAEAERVMAGLAAVGIRFNQVTDLLEAQGVEKFIVSWRSLLATVRTELQGVAR